MPHSPSHQLHLQIPSEHAHLEEVVERSEVFLRKHIEDDDFVYRVILPISEAVTNAIRHGNMLDVEKTVHVEMSVNPQAVVVTVEDEGPGFDREAIRDPLEEANLLREGGRGIYLIESMADVAEFEQGGRRIRMRFVREKPSQSADPRSR